MEGREKIETAAERKSQEMSLQPVGAMRGMKQDNREGNAKKKIELASTFNCDLFCDVLMLLFFVLAPPLLSRRISQDDAETRLL